MSVNHYSSNLPESAHGWPQYMMGSPPKTSSPHHQIVVTSTASTAGGGFWATATAASGPMFCGQSAASFGFNHSNEDEEEEELPESQAAEDDDGGEAEREITKEPLFEKPLTPSDVGKLNRLVIPKQHAEKYFPLHGSGGGDGGGEKGLLLSFEDEVGKSWRFRYSYWNSSQSYVLTKGWSRFVKEKRLDAGDVVLFGRHRGDVGRLLIGWRRRNVINSGGGVQEISSGGAQSQPPPGGGGGGGGWMRRVLNYPGQPYPNQHRGCSSVPYQPEGRHAAGSVIQKQTSSSSAGGNSKRLRLFGVNLEWQDTDESTSEPSTPEGSPMSAQYNYSNHVNRI